MLQRLKVLLSEEEYEALSRLSDQELRCASDQARAILRDRLQRAKLLPVQPGQMEEGQCSS